RRVRGRPCVSRVGNGRKRRLSRSRLVRPRPRSGAVRWGRTVPPMPCSRTACQFLLFPIFDRLVKNWLSSRVIVRSWQQRGAGSRSEALISGRGNVEIGVEDIVGIVLRLELAQAGEHGLRKGFQKAVRMGVGLEAKIHSV